MNGVPFGTTTTTTPPENRDFEAKVMVVWLFQMIFLEKERCFSLFDPWWFGQVEVPLGSKWLKSATNLLDSTFITNPPHKP